MQRLNSSHHYERCIALFGGCYSNWVATEAVLRHARGSGAEDLWFLGDAGGFGPHPDRTVSALVSAGVRCIQGNYDASVGDSLNDCGCGYTDPRDNHYAQLSYDYTLQRSSSSSRAWLRSLPGPTVVEVAGIRVLLCHGSPRRVNEFLWESTTPVGFVSALCKRYDVRLICCTHTGLHWQRFGVDGTGLVNVGAVGRPANDGRPLAWYALLRSQGDVLRADFVPVSYDVGRVAEAMRRERLPAPFVEALHTGWWTTCLEVLPARERARGIH